MSLEIIATFPVGPLQCNCSILADTESREALVIDPGDEPDRILNVLQKNRLRPVALLHTHAHFDHIGVSARLSKITGAPLWLHGDDYRLYEHLMMQADMFGFDVDPPKTVDQQLNHGDKISCGSHHIEVIHTPGHTPGSTCFLVPSALPILFSGDTLFRRSIGRTDLWGGSFDDIVESIEKQIFTLPGDCKVIAGHGEGTTVAEEVRLNPFVGSRSNRVV
jgi:glyoxylase-like metal-dependent hydrolase (beta-lactamase superfamily II)